MERGIVTPSLSDLESCFEGVIPSIIATADAEGVPNISYLSHVVMADDNHIALSNQFFAKTAQNLRLNPQASLLLVDGHTGEQFKLELAFAYALDAGPLFQRIALQLQASSAQIGMANIMRLRSVDVFRVLHIENAPSPIEIAKRPEHEKYRMAAVARVVEAISAQTDADGIIDATLRGLQNQLGFEHALFLEIQRDKNHLVTIGSMGYLPSGIGSDTPLGEGLIGAAAASGRTIKASDMSRVRRLGSAVQPSAFDENRMRAIQLPGLTDALSQIAVPLIANNDASGVLFLESRRRLAFTLSDEAALLIIARQAAAQMALIQSGSSQAELVTLAPKPTSASGKVIHVVHHQFDDSVFIDDTYVIKGVAGRLLIYMLDNHVNTGRMEFANREIRLDHSLRLPDFKDNLETRLLLLRRRLEEKDLPIRLQSHGRGKIGLTMDGQLQLKKTRTS